MSRRRSPAWAWGIILAVIIGLGWLVGWQMSGSSPKAGGRLKGRVTKVVKPQSNQGAYYLQLDNRALVLISAGGLTENDKSTPTGRLEGEPRLGSVVEVYAAKISQDSYTLAGSRDYYVKVLNQ